MNEVPPQDAVPSTNVKQTPPKKNLIGRVFGLLTVLEYAGNRWSHYWKCICACKANTIVFVAGSNLLRKKRPTGSCGCVRTERARVANRARLTSHGKRFTRTYRCWANMKTRATNKTFDIHNNYVNRGITICQRLRVFENFLEDFGECPSIDLSIDRINNDGHYSCGHCEECVANGWQKNIHWATQTQQARNTRGNHMVTWRGETLCIAAWAERTGISWVVLQARITQRKWSAERALTTPVKPSRWSKQNLDEPLPPAASASPSR